MATPSAGTRLNKYLASCGLGSRRACDELIKSGEIKVNGHIVIDPGTQIVEGDSVKHGRRLIKPLELTTILFNKPKGYVCTKNDEKKRPTVFDLLPSSLSHLNHVGRLDADTEGLLILTNDGDLAQTLTHPSTKVEKEYLVTLNQAIAPEELDRLLKGVFIPGEGLAKAKAHLRVSQRRVRVILTTGVKRQIRGMFQGMGFRVTKLVRIRVGSLWGGDLPVGKSTELDGRSISLLRSNPPLQSGFRTSPSGTSESTPAKSTHPRPNAKKATKKKSITIRRKRR